MAEEVVGAQLAQIGIDQIEVGHRLRPVTAERVAIVAGWLRADGQLQPIEVCRLPGETGFHLVVGGHRLAAARELGWTTILARVVEAGRDRRRLREIAENLHRTELTPIERAEFIGQLAEMKRAERGADGLSPQQVASRARWGWQNGKAAKKEAVDACVTMTCAYGWSAEVAEAAGLSRRTVERHVLIYKGLAPSARETIEALPDASVAALVAKFAKLPFQVQESLLGGIRGGAFATLKDALQSLKPKMATPSPDVQRFARVMGTIGQMRPAERQRLFDHLAAQFQGQISTALARSKNS